MEVPSTCWTVVERAGRGDAHARETFVRVYEPVVRRALHSRWEGTHLREHVEDAVQQVLLECFKEGGALSRVAREDPWEFRAFLYGMSRNVARSFERYRRPTPPGDWSSWPAEPDSGLQRGFDRAYAEALLAEALREQGRRAALSGDAGLRRMDLLRLRFWDGLPIREIARRWEADPAKLHREYARAREEFRSALECILREHRGAGEGLGEADLIELLGQHGP